MFPSKASTVDFSNLWRKVLLYISCGVLGLIIGYLVVVLDSSFRPYKVALFCLIILGAIVAIIYSEALLYVFAVLISFPMKVNQIVPVTTDTTTLVLFYSVAVIISRSLARRSILISRNPIQIFVLGFGLFLWISYFIHGAPLRGLWEMVCWTGGILLFFTIQSTIKNGAALVRLLISAYLGVSISALVGIYQYVSKVTVGGLSSTYWYYADFANAIGMLTITVLGLISLGVSFSKKLKILLLLLCIPNLFVLIVSGCRGAWLGAGIGLLYLLYQAIIRKRFKYVLAIFLTLIGGTALAASDPALTERFNALFVLDQGSTHIRLIIWHTVIPVMSSNWLSGIGVGALPDLFMSAQYYNPYFDSIDFYHAHDLYLQMMLNGGVLVAVPFGFIIIRAVGNALRPGISSVLAGLSGGLVVFLVQGAVDYVVWDPANMYLLWLTLGLIIKSTSSMPVGDTYNFGSKVVQRPGYQYRERFGFKRAMTEQCVPAFRD
jgi:O-antigen ligase